jgi:hypothetical protein
MSVKNGDVVSLDINPRYISTGESGVVAYSPDSDRMMDSYDTYKFKSSNYKAFVRGNPRSTAVTLQVRIDRAATEVSHPSEGAVPMGGFHNHEYLCTILSADTVPAAQDDDDEEEEGEEEEEEEEGEEEEGEEDDDAAQAESFEPITSFKVGARGLITIRASNVSAGAHPGKVVYDKDSHVMKAKYDHFVFDEHEYRRFVADPEGEDCTLAISIDGVSSSVDQPAHGAVPSGGFKNTYFTCSVLARSDS